MLKFVLLWNPDTGTWNTSHKLSEGRDALCSWTPDPRGGTYLIGGVQSPSTTEIVHQHCGTLENRVAPQNVVIAK